MEALIWLLIILGGILLIFVATMGIALLLGAITITITSNSGREFQPFRTKFVAFVNVSNE